MEKVQNTLNKLYLRFKHTGFIVAFLTFGLVGCGGGDSVGVSTGCDSWGKDIEAATNKWLDAAAKYANDPTTANCNAYKNAGLDYIKVYNKISKCIPAASLATYRNALNVLKEELNNIDCN